MNHDERKQSFHNPEGITGFVWKNDCKLCRQATEVCNRRGIHRYLMLIYYQLHKINKPNEQFLEVVFLPLLDAYDVDQE